MIKNLVYLTNQASSAIRSIYYETKHVAELTTRSYLISQLAVLVAIGKIYNQSNQEPN